MGMDYEQWLDAWEAVMDKVNATGEEVSDFWTVCDEADIPPAKMGDFNQKKTELLVKLVEIATT